MAKSVTLAFIGDVMLGRGVNEEIPQRSAESFWGDVLPILRGADAVIANLECAITQNTQECRRTPKVFHFRADPAAVEILRAANIQCVNLANNHILDFDDQGLLDTLKYLDAAGIHHAGAGRDINQATTPIIMDIAGLRVGIIALTDNEPDCAATKDSPGTNYLEINPNLLTLSLIESAIAQLRQAGAELIIFSAHWGPNMVISPPLHFRQFARALVDRGVDIFHGHSAHLFQGVEQYKQGLIIYDTGDFLDDYAVDPVLRNDWSFVFLVEVSDRGLYKLHLIPVFLSYTQVDLAKGREFTAICQRMQFLCANFNTNIIQTKENLSIYFHWVNEALQELLKAEHAPLVLAGVEYLLPIYREANTYPDLVDAGITGNPELLSPEELHSQAWEIVEPLFLQAQQDAINQYRELLGTGKASSQITETIPAACQGRVDKLIVALGQQQWGTFDSDAQTVQVHPNAEPNDEELLDFAATQTILNGGIVYAVESAKMPDDTPLAAVFRY